jgi:hypothetical protein
VDVECVLAGAPLDCQKKAVNLEIARLAARAGFLLAVALASSAAQALTQARTPASCANNTTIGTVNWANPGNAITSNTSYATAGVAGGGTTTRYLLCSNYGFNLPAGSRIDGITVNVERRSSSAAAGGVQDAAMRIVQGGVIGTADRSTTTQYTTSDFTEPHGGATDLWGLTWTWADINAANFGAAFATRKNTPGGGTFTIFVDVIGITVDYTLPPTVVSITRASANPTSAATVDWTVTFSEAVSGVAASDFALAATGVSGSSIVSVSGGPTIYTVTVNTGSGTGTLGLNLVDDDSILNAAGVALAGTGTVDGGFTGEVYTVNRPSVAGFNVVESGAHPTTGRIFTKIAGQGIAVDIVALDASNNLSAAFVGDVAVELVDNASGGACSGLPLIKALANETFTLANAGRHPLSAGQFEANAYRNVKFRVRYPAALPTITACSGDAFANRPADFGSVQARHANRTTAGVAAALTNTANPGSGEVHNAGRPFRIDATARNASAAATTLYSPDAGQPLAVLSQCGSGTAACVATPGTLSPGSWSAAMGVVTTTTASYDDIGSFALELEDQTFAAVDAGDGTSTAVRFIRSASSLTVGRFVPDHFALDAGSTIVPRSDIAGCAGSSYTYLGERMDLRFTLRARNAAGADLSRYAGALAGLAFNDPVRYGFGAIDAAAPTLLTSRIDTSLIGGVAATWTAGVASNVTAPISISRNPTADGPFASVRIGIAPADVDGVTLASFDLDTDNNASNERAQIGPATGLRFGRLRLENAVGSEKLDLPIPILTQHWNGTAFQTNDADGCTTISAANVLFSNYFGAITPANMDGTHVSGLGGAFSAGFGSLTLTKPTPTPGSPGAVTVTVDLSAEGKSYLKGDWGVSTYTADPSARAAFGLYGGQPSNFIYFRENY